MTDGEKRLLDARNALAEKAKQLAQEVSLLRAALVQMQPGVTQKEIDMATTASWRLSDLRFSLEDMEEVRSEGSVSGGPGR